ncbi:MAG TPA: DUF2231 domain-containing protein [Nitrospiraceae bacterium]|jgi:uncharacterized membrane protein
MATLAGHPIHPMLIPFPIGLWVFSLISDVVFQFGLGGPLWNDMAFYTMAAGVAGALVAAVPGYLDFRMITEPRVIRVAKAHLTINLSIVVLYIVNLLLRQGSGPGAVFPVLLSILGVALLGVSGWLGGELVFVHGVGSQASREQARSSRRAA